MTGTSKGKILVVGKRPPDYGGVSAVTDAILSSQLLRDTYSFVELSTTYCSRHAETDKAKIKISYVLRRLSMLFRIVRQTKKVKPFLIHYHTGGDYAFLSDLFNLLSLKLMNQKVILHYHTDPTSPFTVFPSQSKTSWKNVLLRSAIRRSDGFLVLGEKYRRFICTHLNVVEEKVIALHNSITRTMLERGGKEVLPVQMHHELKVLYLGRISKLKGFYDLLNIAKLSQDKRLNIRYLVAGNYNSEADEKEALHALGNLNLSNIELLGEVKGNEKNRLFKDVDLLISTSVYEAFPVSLLEAASFEVPCVVYKIGMNEEIVVDGKTGFVLPKDDWRGMHAVLECMFNDRPMIKQLGRAARQYLIEAFSFESFESKLLRCYMQISG